MNVQADRLKSSMIVYQLEKDLGDFVSNHSDTIEDLPETLRKKIELRAAERKDEIDSSSIRSFVEQTYIDELFSFALSVTQGTANYTRISELKKLCVDLDLFAIRNSISHPNRSFPKCFWYRAAAIASDPLIELTGLRNVVKSLLAAEDGKLTLPPEDWFKSPLWELPNNLPEKFDHDITGLLGRNDETKKLRKLITKETVPFLAVVARGGVGKTALLLELIKEITRDHKYSNFFDAVIFISMKTEKLTATGLEKIEAITTMEHLKENIADFCAIHFDLDDTISFDKCVKLFNKKRIFIFADNLETILRDHESDFVDFTLDLPREWKLIVTSRVSINSAYTFPLIDMSEKNSAILARRYSERRGITTLDAATFDTIARKSKNNPLAIRLTIDAIFHGRSIEESINTMKDGVLEFSYGNLIETLPEQCVFVLESLFAGDRFSRSDIAAFLDSTIDEVAEAVSLLSRTSLIRTSTDSDEEIISLNDSVRELLAVNPRNLNARREIREKIERGKNLSLEIQRQQIENSITETDRFYIPDNISAPLKILLEKTHKEIRRKSKNNEDIQRIYTEMNRCKEQYSEESCFWRSMSMISNEIKDVKNSILYAEAAVSRDPHNILNHENLARIHHDNHDYEYAEKIYQDIIKWDVVREKIDLSRRINTSYFLSLLYQHKYEIILEKTKDWKKGKHLRGILGGFRSSALKRTSETKKSRLERLDYLRRALTILNHVAKEDGYTKNVISVGGNIIHEICQILSIYNDGQVSDAERETLEKTLFEASEIIIDVMVNRQDLAKTIKTLSKFKTKNNIFTTKKWLTYQTSDEISDFELPENLDEKILVSVYNIPQQENGFSTFIFF